MSRNFWDEPLRRHHQLSDQVRSLVVPLIDAFQLSQFCYFFVTEEGRAACLSSHLKWTELYHYQGLFLHNPFLRDPKGLPGGGFFQKQMQGIPKKKEFGIGESMVIGLKERNRWEGFSFSLKAGEEDYTSLVNELSLIKRFCKEFKVKAKKSLIRLEEGSVDLPSLIGDLYLAPSNLSPGLTLSKKEKLLSLIGIEIPSLSKREKECLLLYLEGETAHTISLILGLSQRTVEDYLEKLKQKLICFDKRELLQKGKILQEFGILSPYFIRLN